MMFFREAVVVYNQPLWLGVGLIMLLISFVALSSTGACSKESAAYQYGSRWQHEPCVLPYGPGCPDHDRQQLRPIPQQVGFILKPKVFSVVQITGSFLPVQYSQG